MNHKITKEEYDAYDRLAEFNKISLYYTTKEELRTMVEGMFELKGYRIGGDYTGDKNHPVVVLDKV